MAKAQRVVATYETGDRFRKGKLKGRVVGQVGPFIVYANPHFPKTERGKKRLWISIRQIRGERYRQYAALITPHGVDIQFEAKKAG